MEKRKEERARDPSIRTLSKHYDVQCTKHALSRNVLILIDFSENVHHHGFQHMVSASSKC